MRKLCDTPKKPAGKRDQSRTKKARHSPRLKNKGTDG
ncbi:unnamed protein product [Schistosoma curassoni]|uniref:Metal homeostasis protein n=1 Tax=Schistosoma curassoni TaxID=6186 RepID=A0A183JM40_9TREM|nr:unnamed protein product [Schistosoma curassoni]